MSDTMLERVARAIEKLGSADMANYQHRERLTRAAVEVIGQYVVVLVEDHPLCELTKAGNRDPFVAFSVGAKAQRDATAKALSSALSDALSEVQSTGEKK